MNMMGANPFGPELLRGISLAVWGCALVGGFAISVAICALLYVCYSRIPVQFRKQEPGLVWLLLIPCFNFVWNFFVYLQLADSYQAYFASVGRTDVGDCGKGIGLGYAICIACCIVPCLNLLAAPAALVLLIIYLVKAMDLKSQIPSQGAN